MYNLCSDKPAIPFPEILVLWRFSGLCCKFPHILSETAAAGLKSTKNSILRPDDDKMLCYDWDN